MRITDRMMGGAGVGREAEVMGIVNMGAVVVVTMEVMEEAVGMGEVDLEEVGVQGAVTPEVLMVRTGEALVVVEVVGEEVVTRVLVTVDFRGLSVKGWMGRG
jgi:hypothetical protein